MKVVPVMDVAGGKAVHAQGGDREQYGPVESALSPSADPLRLAAAFRDRLGLIELYVADLDSIRGGQPHWDLYRALLRDGFSLMLDAGVRDLQLAVCLSQMGVRSVVVGLETLKGPQYLMEIVQGLGAPAVVLGLDLRRGVPLGDARLWGQRDAAGIAAFAFARKASRFLVLDLACVGSDRGPPVAAARAVVARCPGAEVLVGGGVRDRNDLEDLARLGVRGALVATALHRGTLDRAAVDACRGWGVTMDETRPER
jgi:phosphoribosylformimino-5-aminoimidazole carboxamide ribotide isomerase